MIIRALKDKDAEKYTRFFIRGVTEHPQYFRSAPCDFESGISLHVEETANSTTFLAFEEEKSVEKWLGIVTVVREQGCAKRRHIAWIIRMYVAQEATGKGVGRQLLQSAIAKARLFPEVTQINLTVVESNLNAKHLYISEGFQTFSREENAVQNEDGTWGTEEAMVLVL
jgi:GNAT superfamily N-acetyltransferase